MEIDIIECDIHYSHNLTHEFVIEATYVGKDFINWVENAGYIKFNVALNDKAIVVNPHIIPNASEPQPIEEHYLIKQKIRITGDRLCIVPNEISTQLEKMFMADRKKEHLRHWSKGSK